MFVCVCVTKMNVLESKSFQMLQEEERERVLLLKTRFDKLFELEKLAFLELCGLVSTTATADNSNKENYGKLSHYSSPRLATVQARDAGFVVLQQSVDVPSNKTPANDGDYTNASSDASLRKLIQPSLFGEGRVGIRKERKSLYEKIGMEGEDEEESEEDIGKGANAPPPIGVPGEYNYRSNAYQAIRLAHSFPQHINVHPNVRDDQQTANMMNATGMPLYENELRGFFEELDSNHCGQLDLEDFQQFMRRLDRSLGVDDEYARLEKEGSRLAADGKLGFEAFAYLVLRFARA